MTDVAVAPVPQRLVLVLPTSGEFDSRTFRIATTCAARGHTVTVLARADPGRPPETLANGGYRTVRVAVEAIDGLPAAGLWRRVRKLGRRPGSANATTVRGSEAIEGPAGGAPAAAATSGGPPVPSGSGVSSSVGRRLLGRAAAARRAVVRVAAIVLTVRAQTAAARRVDPGADLYHGMAYMGIPVALDLASRRHVPVVYDARDIYLEARNLARLPRPARWLVGRAERGWAKRATRVVTVNRAYAEVLEQRLRVPQPLIVMNCSSRYRPAEPRERRFHDRFGLAAERAVVLYHGGFFQHRGIEELVAAIAALDRADLVLMGYGALEASLPALIAASPAHDRIHVMRAVPPEVLHDWVAAADVVAMPIQPSTLNHRLTTPNKLFEAMAAGVPVVASDLPGMATIVRETGCGILCDPTDPVSIGRAIRGIIEAPAAERAAYAERARRAAETTYNWEAQAEILLAEYGRLTGRPW